MAPEFQDNPTTLRLDARSGALRERTYQVKVLEGPDRGRAAEVRGTFVVGSHPDADLPLSDPSVSRKHLELEARSDGVRLRDLGSRNGTFSGGLRVSEGFLSLEEPAVICLGQTRLQLSVKERALPVAGHANHFGEAYGDSPPMRRLFGMLERVARSDATVLLRGETGCGKEVLARALHAASPRRDGPFVVADCASLAPTLIESELFGHVKGAFTGAISDRKGAFLRAEGGTLFLDEVGELPVDVQPRLLRALESGRVQRVGEDEPRRTNARVVAATHRNLEAEVGVRKFRQDLYFRLAVVVVEIPPLRTRLEDVPGLVQRFLRDLGPEAPRAFAPEVLSRLERYDWPGNVRELRNVVQRLATGVEQEPGGRPAPGAMPAAGAPKTRLPFKHAKERFFEGFVRDYLGGLIQDCKGNLSEVARQAGINRNYVQRLVDRYRLEVRRR